MKKNLLKMTLAVIGSPILFTNSTFAADSTTNAVIQTNESSPFKIIVTPRKTRVHIGEPFKVALEVKNASNTNQSFKVYNCGWFANWRSDNPEVELITWPCWENAVTTVNLAPGESFKEASGGEEREMQILQSASTNRISFRMIFHPEGEKIPADTKEKIYWSDEVTIEVIPH